MPEISVIVPVYKAEKYLDRCVESVVSQTFHDFELILVDDGSPDNCPTMCDAWVSRDERIQTVHKRNGGASSARNAGLSIAKGRWIAFADSDDWLPKTALETLHRLANEHNVPMAMGEMFNAKCEENVPLTDRKKKSGVQKLSQTDLLNRFFRLNGEPDTHSVWGLLIRKDILADYRFIEGKMNEDVETCYYLARKCCAAVYTNEIVYYYFKNADGVTNSCFSKKKLDLLDVWNMVQEQVAQYTPEYTYACKMNCKRARFTLLTQMHLNGYDHNDAFMKKTKQQLKKEVRASFGDLMKWKMPVSRKIMMCFLVVLR